MPRYIQKRRRGWYAVLDIPLALRPHFGGRGRFVVTLRTRDASAALRRSVAVIAGWQADLARAKGAGAEEGDSGYFRRLLREARSDDARAAILERIGDAADAVGYLHAEVGRPPSSAPEAQAFVAQATGAFVGTLEHLEEWLDTLHGAPRTKDQRRTGARRVASAFPLLRDISKPEVRKWAAVQVLAPKSIVIILGGMRIYWRWLQAAGIVAEGANPFEGVDIVRRPAEDNARRAFTAIEIVKLRGACRDPLLHDLITLAMWTGARIEELCSLRVEHVGPESFRIMASKTQAGVREVPIHAKLAPTLGRLTAASSDGYVLPGLAFNRYQGRANALGKRFSALKTAQGFGPVHTFHSIRRTVVTLLENAGAAENVVASIVGHDIQTITYGLYSGGATLAVKAAALALLDYPD
jgi:integrase